MPNSRLKHYLVEMVCVDFHLGLLAQLTAIDPDESTAEAIDGWHYWVGQGYVF